MTSTLSQLLFAYVVGGLTFIPLVLAAILVPAWLALPRLEEGGQRKRKNSGAGDEGDENAEEKLRVAEEEHYGHDGDDGTATATFAVLRKYDFPAANAALNARGGTQNTGGAGNGTDGAADGLGGSESVYQSMYRSVFDRSRTTTPPNALANASDEESSTASDSRARRKPSKPAPANVFFIVLRHGHLMLYDSPAQLEVRHVISLAHHSVSLSDGGGDDMAVDEPITDGDLFIKRTAIVLSPLAAIANGGRQTQSLAPKPFYLFTPTSILKESFYHALLLASPSPPTPQPLDPQDLIKLQTTLHSTIMTAETRALNAVISRIFLALSGTDLLKDFIRAKIEKKISRVQKPGFINALALQEIDLGNAAPVVANLRLKDLKISGDVTISCDIRYTGSISLALAAQARLDLGPRFKARTVDLLLSSSLKRLSGHMLVRIKPPPSNRLWFCFDGMPDMEIKVEPVVSSRQITYGFILRQIEERIRAVIAETLVKPNWDDIQFFDTRGQKVRGGIWASEGEDENVEDAPAEAEILARKGEKTMSMPVLTQVDAEAESTSSGTETPRRDRDAELKRRSVVSLPAQTSSTSHLPTIDSEERVHSSQSPRPLRSPSLTSPSASAPSIALDGSPANFDPSVKPPSQKSRTWGRRHLAQPPTRKEVVDAVREVRDRSFYTREAEAAASSGEASADRVLGREDNEASSSGTTKPGRTATGLSTVSAASSASASTIGTTTSVQSESARQKKAASILAAATTATTAAKNWSWNAIQNRAAKNAAGRRSSEASGVPSPQEPMGRGQPLPPPGMPLPGPPREKSLWAGSGFAVPVLSGSMKRKPVLPKRPIEQVHEDPADAKSADNVDEFGEWEENSGDRVEEERQTPEQSSPVAPKRTEAKVPPPLPKRRKPEDGPALISTEERDAVGTVPSHALDAAKLATGTRPRSSSPPLRADYLEADSGEVDLDTTAAHLSAGSTNPNPDSLSSNAEMAIQPPSESTALPAKPAGPGSQPSNSDPEDLVVVAAPVESGRNTPAPPVRDQEGEREREQIMRPKYDGDGWGEVEDGSNDGEADYEVREDEDWDDEVEEGMPKASFSRSRDDGFELHQ